MKRRTPDLTTRPMRGLRALLRRFRRDEDGTSTIEFLFLFPVIFMLFGTTLEAGMYSMQQVMLERGLDLTVREVRLGIIANPTHDKLVTSTCRYAVIFPDCKNQLRLEMIKQSPTAFTPMSRKVPCINTVTDPKELEMVPGKNNDLMILRACVRLEPLMPFAGLGAGMGAALTDNGKEKFYSLSATTSFVLEPFLFSAVATTPDEAAA